jgi:hypothetical protein
MAIVNREVFNSVDVDTKRRIKTSLLRGTRAQVSPLPFSITTANQSGTVTSSSAPYWEATPLREVPILALFGSSVLYGLYECSDHDGSLRLARVRDATVVELCSKVNKHGGDIGPLAHPYTPIQTYEGGDANRFPSGVHLDDVILTRLP